MVAAMLGCESIVEQLLGTGTVNVNFEGYAGYTALEYAVRQNDKVVVNLLITAGAVVANTVMFDFVV